MTKLCFIDTETTGLDRRRRRIWDFACIVREEGQADVEHQFFIEVSLRNADPFGLNIGHFWERYPGWQVAGHDTSLTTGATWVGAVPSFDEESCEALLHRAGRFPRWDYHLVDVETAAAALAGISPPWKNDVVNLAYNIQVAPEDRHTALGDARACRDLYDAVFKP